jgi:leader peptidase (prepilin peptidase)/N-methyltransferase
MIPALFWSALAGMAALLVAISYTDMKTYRILNIHNALLFLAGVIYAVLSKKGLAHVLLGSVVGGGFLLVVRWVYGLRGKAEGLGLGDVKFMIAAGAWLGWQGIAPMLVIAALAGLSFAMLAHVTTRLPLERELVLPFGPFLAFGLFIVFALQENDMAPWLWFPDDQP